jgi:hypothetical protein
MRDRQNQETYNAEHKNEDAQQEATNKQVGHPLVFGPGMGDAEGSDERLGEPREEFQCSVRSGPEYVIWAAVNCTP